MLLDAKSFYIPKSNPLKPLGEDAHFFNKAAQVIGIADGVGGWAKHGIDAGEYARELMTNAENAVYYRRPGQVDPKKVLVEAHHRTEAPGSSTACIIALAGNRLVAANLGDSGFVVMRDGDIFYESAPQQHSFNHPYQLRRKSDDKSDPPEAADELEVEVEIGDVVVAGTDGLFDNLYPLEIEDIVNECSDWTNLAEDLARAAYLKSEGYGGMLEVGPFWEAAVEKLDGRLKKKTCQGRYHRDIRYHDFKLKHGYCIFRTGGKIDDITAVVARIVP